MVQEEKQLRVTITPEETPILCGLTKGDQRRIDFIHNTVDTLHSLCETRTGMAEQVKPAVSFKIREACILRDLMIRHANKFLGELIEKVKRTCP